MVVSDFFRTFALRKKNNKIKVMEYEKVFEIVVKDGYYHTYIATLNNGERKQVRLFYKMGGIYRMTQRSRKTGCPLWGYSEWERLKLVDSNKQVTDDEIAKRMIKRAKNALKYLSRSGFWSDLKAEIEYFLANDTLALEIVKDYRSEGNYYENIYSKMKEGEKYAWMRTYQVFEAFLSPKCWMTIPWDGHKPYCEELYKKALEEGTRQSFRWTKGYDATYIIDKVEEGKQRGAWYSNEYRNCGNGHYGLLLDATHAIIYEDD